MSPQRIRTITSLALMLLSLVGGRASASSIVVNGSLETGSFVNTTCGYMALGAGSTTITGWTVAPATTGNIVWANSPTCDGFSASNGSFFVDLSGFGESSVNGAIQQGLTTTIGQSYAFSMDR